MTILTIIETALLWSFYGMASLSGILGVSLMVWWVKEIAG